MSVTWKEKLDWFLSGDMMKRNTGYSRWNQAILLFTIREYDMWCEKHVRVLKKQLGLHSVPFNTLCHRICVSLTSKLLTTSVAQRRSYLNPHYSLDPSPFDFSLTPKLNNQLQEIQLNDDEEMLQALDEAIGSLTKMYLCWGTVL